MTWDMSVICIDHDCPKFNQKESVLGRIPIVNHIQKKSDDQIIKILKLYGVIDDHHGLTRHTLVNILADCCYSKTATRLIKKLGDLEEVSFNA